MSDLHWFYVSKEWRKLCWILKIKANKRCQRCGAEVLDISYLIGHHKIELTSENVHDPNLSLNPDNIEVICPKCHNKEHRRFGQYAKQVYVVWGCPLSGKTAAVREMMRPGDIVLDINSLWQAITFQPDHPNACKYNVFGIRDTLMDHIKTRYGRWCDAYIIGGYPNRYDRERLAQEYGATLIYCEVDKAECFKRAQNTDRPEEYKKYVADWWEMYERTA